MNNNNNNKPINCVTLTQQLLCNSLVNVLRGLSYLSCQPVR